MEFFAFAKGEWTEQDILDTATLDRLPDLAPSIVSAREIAENHGVYWTIWGEFEITRQPIRGGVRFTMPTCPNAFAWTLTTGFPPVPDAVTVHATINRTEHDPDFIESIRDFTTEWKAGLEGL